MTAAASVPLDCDYVVVGSGAGGGTVAARLAEAGFRVVLLEAGGDPCTPREGDTEPTPPGIPEHYEVPVFHAMASENAAMRWDFHVRHHDDDAQQRRDDKYLDAVDGVLYPRAGTLGGCTSHNAMLFACPHDGDWDHIAALTGDASWRATAMRRYFERVENCGHRPVWRWLAKLGINPTRHGWAGWLHTEKVVPKAAVRDRRLVDTVFDVAISGLGRPTAWARRLRWALVGAGDPNDWRLVRENADGLRYAALSTHRGRRVGSRERLLDVAARCPEHLHIELDALATRVLLDESQRAVGVEYLKGARLYRAHAEPSSDAGERRVVRAAREVILAGGAFNTPQLLMLSGIGARDALATHGIACRVDLPGVGRNLQDRYEIGVVNRMSFRAWEMLEGAHFSRDDAPYAQWARTGQGVYATNGVVLSYIRRSRPDLAVPDLYCFALMGKFRGYFPGYSKLFPAHPNCLTWAVLKAHTHNRAGQVLLRSADPRDTPRIHFRYFGDNEAGDEADLDAMVDGVRFVRTLSARLKAEGMLTEELPGDAVHSDADLRAHIRDNAWGHHASCSAAIGPRADGGVLDSDFRVHGCMGLRVVDASVFPRIPGFFIVGAVYMVAEKAADALLAAAAAAPPPRAAERPAAIQPHAASRPREST